MALKKVRHALVTWNGGGDARDADYDPKMAFRGEVVDIPEGHTLDRLIAEHAVTDADLPLERPGRMYTLPESPSDEELLTWVAEASDAEIGQLAETRPNLLLRIRGALDAIKRVRENERDVFAKAGAVADNVDDLIGDRERRVQEIVDQHAPLSPAAGPSGPVLPRPNVETPGGAARAAAADYGALIDGKAEDVAAYIADHPGEAQAVLDAETEHRNGNPRHLVIRAAQAAVGHTR